MNQKDNFWPDMGRWMVGEIEEMPVSKNTISVSDYIDLLSDEQKEEIDKASKWWASLSLEEKTNYIDKILVRVHRNETTQENTQTRGNQAAQGQDEI